LLVVHILLMPILETIWSDNWKLYAQATLCRLARKVLCTIAQKNSL
jgi:hypothetical protein